MHSVPEVPFSVSRRPKKNSNSNLNSKKKKIDGGSNPRPLDPVYSALDRSATLDPPDAILWMNEQMKVLFFKAKHYFFKWDYMSLMSLYPAMVAWR